MRPSTRISVRLLPLWCWLLVSSSIIASFQPLARQTFFRGHCRNGRYHDNHNQQTLFMSGYGIAKGYTWKEEALEIEVTVQVPPGTKSKDVHFKPGITSIDLRVDNNSGAAHNNNQLVLMDGNRKLRGRISLDGTFWVFSDRRRSITVTLEKYFAHSNDDMRVLDYDWKGVYPKDDEEVMERKYDEPKVLNVREYAASLGVDIDNINRSMVDKTMFSSGLNLTQRALEQLKEQGYVTEVTKQADGSEFQTNRETGEAEPFSFQHDTSKPQKKSLDDLKRVNIPFIDTSSPWHQTVPVSVDPKTNKTSILDEAKLRETLKKNANSQSAAIDSEEIGEKDEGETSEAPDPRKISDPIDLLTVKRLKEILKQQGLKVTGSKQELQDRLRSQVGSLLKAQSKDTRKST